MRTHSLRMSLALPLLFLAASCTVHVDESRQYPPPSPPPTKHLAAEGALGPYSGSVRAGELVFVSGKIGIRGGTFDEEVRSAIDAAAAELERQGLSLADVVASTVYLTDLERYAELNAIYAEVFPPPYPARVCVEVSRLPGDARVEIQVVARGR